MKRILKYFLIILMSFVLSSNVNADTFNDYIISDYITIPGVYVTALGATKNTYNYLNVIARASDKQFVYCIEPGTKINGNTLYSGFDYDYSLYGQMQEQEWERISLLAYYGYGYTDNLINHSDLNWYAATQFLIWQTVPRGFDIFFTDKIKGKNRIEVYTTEMKELNELVDNHKIQPSFANNTYNLFLGQEKTLTDNNNVLEKYEKEKNDAFSLTKQGNELIISPKKVGVYSVNLIKKSNKYFIKPIVYNGDSTQKVMARGDVEDFNSTFNINVVGGKISLNKLDNDTSSSKAQGDATLKGAQYDLLDENRQYVTTLITDKFGYAESEEILIPNKTYYLKEIKPSKGYLLDTQEHSFIVKEDNLNLKLNLKERVKKSKVEIYKVFASNKTGIMTPEDNVTFDIYLKSNNTYINSITTNKGGYASLTLPYGTYIFKQKNAKENYEKMEDFEVTISENTPESIVKVISNAELNAKLKLIKVDRDSHKTIKKNGLKFKIKNLDTNEYVCQKITYPYAANICEFETKNGVFITPFPLSYGNYQIEELENSNLKGYLWNDVPLKFTISNDTIKYVDSEPIIEVMFENEEVKGEVNINKKGEKVVIKNGKFSYQETELDNVTFELYANENIFSADGTLVHKKGELIGEYSTKKGSISIKNLYLGKYYLIETSTNKNHILDIKKHYFTLKYTDQYTPTVILNLTLKNYLKKGTLEFSKLDTDTKEFLPNTRIQIYSYNKDINDAKIIFDGVTDKLGKIILKDLFAGKFYLKEVEAPINYQINNDKIFFEITKNGEIIKKYLMNKKIETELTEPTTTTTIPTTTPPNNTEFKVPNTQTYKTLYIIIAIVLSLSLCIIIKIYVFKKNK